MKYQKLPGIYRKESPAKHKYRYDGVEKDHAHDPQFPDIFHTTDGARKRKVGSGATGHSSASILTRDGGATYKELDNPEYRHSKEMRKASKENYKFPRGEDKHFLHGKEF